MSKGQRSERSNVRTYVRHRHTHPTYPAFSCSRTSGETVYFDFTSISDFRLQTSDSGPTHAACYSLGTESFSKEQDAHPPTKMHSQSKLTSISDFDCTSAFQTSHFKKASDKAMISDFRIGFRFQAHARERNRNPEFDFRFQISDSRKGEKSKSGVRFQISYFRLAQGRELKSRVSFQFQVSISGERS